MKVEKKDRTAAREALERAAKASWWEWDAGSRPFHWRWPQEYRKRIRDGVPVFFQSQPPLYRRAQKPERNPRLKELILKKLNKVRHRGYITPDVVVALTAFFAVPKGEDDIRMVYDGSVSGLNDAIWVPTFTLPTAATHLRAVEPGTHMADLDIGEMFLNFMLHEQVRPYAGVDVTHLVGDNNDGPRWEAWQRCAMGLKSSPYQSCQAMSFAEEIIRGSSKDMGNPFRWDVVRMNESGSDGYDPSLPWVSKVRADDGKIAADLFVFVDDVRPTGSTKAEAWKACRRAGATLTHLGIQDAARKRRRSSMDPGAWAGVVVSSSEGRVTVLVSEEKWKKGKRLVSEVGDMRKENSQKLDRKHLERVRGFLHYICQTYRPLGSYLIGFHMTIDGWRPNRDSEGWKTPRSEWTSPSGVGGEYDPGPATVKAVPRLQDDVAALQKLMEAPLPPKKSVQCHASGVAYYGFGDASGPGFGAMFQVGDRIEYEYGQWCSEVTEQASSNWRELNNLVEALEGVVARHKLRGHEIFIFTDNSTAEAAYWKGTSSSKRLFELVLRLKILEMEHQISLHVVHVSGKRMIQQGTDGLSRADHSMGSMQGIPIRKFVPLHLNCLEREPSVRRWWNEILSGLNFQWLTPEGWFREAHSQGNFVWTPPPFAGEVVVEQLGKCRLKRPESMHLVLIPRLMTGRFRRLLGRGSEWNGKLVWEDLWPMGRHFEPLLIFVCLPYRSWEPKFSERESVVEELSRIMQAEGLRESSGKRRRNLLRKLFCKARSLCPLS